MYRGTDERLCLTCGHLVSGSVCLFCGYAPDSTTVLGPDGLPVRKSINTVSDDSWYLASMLEDELEVAA